jgi:hypothetical protein
VASDDDSKSNRFSLQTMFVWMGLVCLLLAVATSAPKYLESSLVLAIGLGVLHQALHERSANWHIQAWLGILICCSSLVVWLVGSPLRSAIEIRDSLRELKESLQELD